MTAGSRPERGAGAGRSRRGARQPPGEAGGAGGPKAPKALLAVEVVWGDIRTAKGNVHVVGHYQNVLPQFAELALDRAVSAPGAGEERLMLTSLTRAGTIRGTLGDVFFVPWSKGTVVVAGMGRPGLFRERELRVLWRSVVQIAGRLPGAETLCTVLIGAGAGNLQVPHAARNMLLGVVDAMRAILEPPSPGSASSNSRWTGRSKRLETLKRYAGDVGQRVTVEVAAEHVVEEGGIIPSPFCYSVLSAAVARASGSAPQSRLRTALRAILDQVPDLSLRQQIEHGLARPASDKKREAAEDLLRTALQFRIREPDMPRDQGSPRASRSRAGITASRARRSPTRSRWRSER